VYVKQIKEVFSVCVVVLLFCFVVVCLLIIDFSTGYEPKCALVV
jgi:hypothetical protein